MRDPLVRAMSVLLAAVAVVVALAFLLDSPTHGWPTPARWLLGLAIGLAVGFPGRRIALRILEKG